MGIEAPPKQYRDQEQQRVYSEFSSFFDGRRLGAQPQQGLDG